MNILALNAGSSTLKFKVFRFPEKREKVRGLCERIGLEGSCVSYIIEGNQRSYNAVLENHNDALHAVLKVLTEGAAEGLQSLEEIAVIGHRIAHGGDRFVEPTVIDDAVLEELEACKELAPLHNEAALRVIKACREVFEHVPMVAVFDTSFHQTMPQKAYMYAVPYELYETYKVRRYGFHGTSHKYASGKAAEVAGVPLNNSKIIVCHLGNGASITAVQNGKSVDTSMGFTPLEGLVMGTRSGDIDPSVVGFLVGKTGLSQEDVLRMLNTESGLKGISKKSSDFREVLEAMNTGDSNATLAIEMFIYRIRKYIGSYIAVMDGVDVLVFTGGIGEKSSYVRAAVCEGFSYVEMEIDKERNESIVQNGEISTDESKVKVMVVCTDEELMIAQEAYETIYKGDNSICTTNSLTDC